MWMPAYTDLANQGPDTTHRTLLLHYCHCSNVIGTIVMTGVERSTTFAKALLWSRHCSSYIYSYIQVTPYTNHFTDEEAERIQLEMLNSSRLRWVDWCQFGFFQRAQNLEIRISLWYLNFTLMLKVIELLIEPDLGWLCQQKSRQLRWAS